MVSTLEFELRLSRQGQGGEPEVRFWLDANGDQRMDPSEEIAPVRREGLLFRATAPLSGHDAAGVGFLVRIAAERGARYRLRIWLDDNDSRREVFDQADAVAESPHRIIGWCR